MAQVDWKRRALNAERSLRRMAAFRRQLEILVRNNEAVKESWRQINSDMLDALQGKRRR